MIMTSLFITNSSFSLDTPTNTLLFRFDKQLDRCFCFQSGEANAGSSSTLLYPPAHFQRKKTFSDTKWRLQFTKTRVILLLKPRWLNLAVEISQVTGGFFPTMALPAPKRKSSVNGTIGLAEVQYIWYKNVIKIVTKCQTAPNKSCSKRSQSASRAYGFVELLV